MSDLWLSLLKPTCVPQELHVMLEWVLELIGWDSCVYWNPGGGTMPCANKKTSVTSTQLCNAVLILFA